jgi:hypothetical protein
MKIGKIELSKNCLINKEILKEIFENLSQSKDEIKGKDALAFYSDLIEKFEMKKEIIVEEYDEKAFVSFRYPKRINIDRLEYLKNLLNTENYNFYQFQKGFLLLINESNLFKLDINLTFTQLTLRSIDIFTQKEIEKRKKNKVTKNQKITTIQSINESEFQLPQQKGLRLTIFTLILQHLSAKDTLNLGLVSKEFLAISRNDTLWKSYIKEEYMTDLESK